MAALLDVDGLDAFDGPRRPQVHGPPVGGAPVELDAVVDREFWSAYLAIAELGPSVRVVLERADATLVPAHVLGIGRAAALGWGDLAHLTPPTGEPSRTGFHWPSDTWSLHLAAGRPTTILVFRDAGGIILVDGRLLAGDPGLPDGVRTLMEGPPPGPSDGIVPWSEPWRAGLIEGAILLALLLVGGLVVPRGSLPRALRLPVALVSGLAVQMVVGLLRLSGLAPLLVAGAIALSAAFAINRRGRPTGWTSADLPAIGGTAVLVLATAVWARMTGFIAFAHADNAAYLSGARVLSRGLLTTDVLDLKRGLGQQSLHALGFRLGTEGMQSLGAITLLVAILLVLLLPQAMAHRPSRHARAYAALAAVALVVSPQVRVMAAAVNSHALVAVLLLTSMVLLGCRAMDTVGAGAPGAPGAPGVPAVPLSLILASLVLLRPEGTLLAGLLLLGTVRSDRPAPPMAWWSLGATTIAWNALLVVGAWRRGGTPAGVVLLMLLVGVGLSAVPSLLGRIPVATRRSGPVAVALLLWAVMLALLIGPFEGVTFLQSAQENIAGGAGGWGSFGPVVILLASIGVMRWDPPTGAPGLAAGRWLLIGFVPLVVLSKLGDGFDRPDARFAMLLDGGGRVGWSDSTNRMWMHAVLVAIAVAMSILMAPTAGDPAGRRRGPSSLVLLAIAAFGVGALWEPGYVRSETRATRDLATDGESVVGELVAGRWVEQPLLLPVGFDPPPDALRTEICVATRFVTFGRRVTGAIDVRLEGEGWSASERIDTSTIRDWEDRRICHELVDGSVGLDGLRLRVEGVDAAAGSAVSLLAAPEARTLPVAILGASDRPGGSPAAGPLVLTVSVAHVAPEPWPDPFDRGSLGRLTKELVLRLPQVAAGLTVAVLVLMGPGRRSYRSRAGSDRVRMPAPRHR